MTVPNQFGGRIQYTWQSTGHGHRHIARVTNGDVRAGNQLGDDLPSSEVGAGDGQCVRVTFCSDIREHGDDLAFVAALTDGEIVAVLIDWVGLMVSCSC